MYPGGIERDQWHEISKTTASYFVFNDSVFLIIAGNPQLTLFHDNVPFLYSLKTSEKQSFFDVFRGYRNGTFARKGLTL